MMNESTNKEIHLQGDVDPIGRRSVQKLMQDGVVHSVVYHDQIHSTNTAALCEIQENEGVVGNLPRLVLADRQVAGRGRRGRKWSSDEGTLTFSLIVDCQNIEKRNALAKYSSLAVGLGIARFVEYEFAPIRVKLKWPNDVYVAGGKLAGILIEVPSGKSDCFVIGVGMNVGTEPFVLDSRRFQSVSCLARVLGRTIERYELLQGLIESILESVDGISEAPSELLGEFRARCMLTGQQIVFQNRGVQTQGTCLGIGENGSLKVLCTGGEIEINTGEANLLRLDS